MKKKKVSEKALRRLFTTTCWAVGQKFASCDMVTENEIYLERKGKGKNECLNVNLKNWAEVREANKALLTWANEVSPLHNGLL
jgi:hypothetical protein